VNDDIPERDLLRTIDPAATHLVNEDARHHNLLAVLDRIEPEARPARTRGLRGRFALAIPTGILLVGAAVLVSVITVTPPPNAPTATSTADAGTPTALLAGSVTRGGVTILAETTVGTAQFLLGQLGDDTRFGASFNGSDPDDNWETVGVAEPTTDRAVTLSSAYSFPDAAPGGVATLIGRVGPLVTGLTFATRESGTVTAEVSNGYFIAAWTGPEFSGPGIDGPGITVTYADGSSESLSYSELLPD
jgi:hypothetical protein